MTIAQRSALNNVNKRPVQTRPWVLFGWALFAICLSASIAAGQAHSAGAIQAIDEKPSSGGASVAAASAGGSRGKAATSSSKASTSGRKSTVRPVAKASPRVTTSTANPAKYDGMVLGDKYTFLNFEIVSPVQPVYTIKAKNAGASGLVQVEVLIDPNGSVLAAHARTGNSLLHPEAEKAALATKFNRPTVYGKPARALGFVVYRFGKSEDDDEN